MALLRLLAGMGMGAAMPNATTLLSEYAPLRRRSLMITIMFSGFTLGSAAIGFIAGYMIPHFGWRSVLLVGGVTPLVLVPFLVALLPESARYMALHGTPADRIAATLGRVTGYRFTGGETFVSTEPPLPTKRPIGVLFSDGYAATTIAALGHLFHGPDGRLFADGMAADPDEGRGRIDHHRRQRHGDVPDRRHDRRDPDRMEHGPGTSFPGDRRRVSGGRAVFILGLAWVGALSGWLAALVFAAGFCASGAQTGLNAFAPSCYPTIARATGVHWMLGMGRFGSIVGSLVGGALLGLGWGFGAILGILAIPALCAAGSFPREAPVH
jgi:AAHS family 4-hydroxybenzoate transporter-like MFS transporter